jgi:hypothetical protein
MIFIELRLKKIHLNYHFKIFAVTCFNLSYTREMIMKNLNTFAKYYFKHILLRWNGREINECLSTDVVRNFSNDNIIIKYKSNFLWKHILLHFASSRDDSKGFHFYTIKRDKSRGRNKIKIICGFHSFIFLSKQIN